MEPEFVTHYQLGRGGSLVFEYDLTALALHLDRPFPEFMGTLLLDHPERELWWLVEAICRGKVGDPTLITIEFEVMENTWANGLAQGLQEMLARLCRQHPKEIPEEHFRHLTHCDDTGCPMNMPGHHEMSHHMDHLDFLMSSTQQEADRARTKANLGHFTLLESRGTIKLLAKERRRLRRQRQARDDTIEKLKARVSKLKDYVSDLENHLKEVEEEGIDLPKERDFLLSDDKDYLEDMDMEDHEDEDDDEFINDEDEDVHVVDLDDESEASDVQITDLSIL
jgi:cell division protein FtsB